VPSAWPERSFEAVVLPHLDAAYNLARYLMRDIDAAEDVLQQAMVRALTYFGSFKGGNARAWLLQVVRNTAYSSIKLNRGMQTVPLEEMAEGVEALTAEGDTPEVALIKGQDRFRVRELLAGLPVELRETLLLREFEELSYKEVATVTGVPIGTVMSRLWRARRMLAQAARASAET